MSRDTEASGATGPTNKATARILEILTQLRSRSKPSHRVIELSRALGMTKQMVIRALHTLGSDGYVVKNAEGSGYEPGYRILELGGFDPTEPDLRQICSTYMQQIHALTRATVLLAIPVGYHVIVIDGIDGREESGFQLKRHRRGYLIPLNVGPLCRPILAFLPDEEIRKFIQEAAPFSGALARNLVDPNAEALWAHIRVIRERGYDIGGGEMIPGALGIGFPILNGGGYPLGAISISLERYTGERLSKLIPTLKQLMSELNERTRAL